MNAPMSMPVSDENPLDLDQPPAHSGPGTQNVEREVRDEAQLRRGDATRRRRRPTQVVMGEWKDSARSEYRPFAAALRAAMSKKGMSASDVARDIWGDATDRRGYNVAKNRDKIGLYLAATAYPDEETIGHLARVLDVSVEELAGKMVQETSVSVTAPGASLWLNNPGPRPTRSSGPSLTPAPGRPGMIRIQVDQIVDWRLAMRVFSELSQAAEVEAEVEGKDVANAVAKVQARARAEAAAKERTEASSSDGDSDEVA